MSDFESLGENIQAAIAGPHATRWSGILWITMLLYVTSGVVTLLPGGFVLFDAILIVFSLGFLVCWLLFPLWLYLDRRRAMADTDYRPSKLYYLGWLPGYLGVAALVLYLHRRGDAYRSLDDEKEPSAHTSHRESDRDTQF